MGGPSSGSSDFGHCSLHRIAIAPYVSTFESVIRNICWFGESSPPCLIITSEYLDYTHIAPIYRMTNCYHVLPSTLHCLRDL